MVCSTPEEAAMTRFYATQARDKAPHYQHSKVGYNYRMSNICAGIGRGQMYVLEEHINARRRNHALYREQLKNVKGISFLVDPTPDYQSNHWLTCIIIDPLITGFTREDLRLKMEEANIETRPLWKPMHLQPVFAGCPFYGNTTSEKLFEKGLCLPSGPTLTQDEIIRVIDVISRMAQL